MRTRAKTHTRTQIDYFMCLYPRMILNKRYLPTKKNGYRPPKLHDQRLKYVAVGCGNCIECRQQKAREWQTRLNEEMKSEAKKAYFINLSVSEETYDKITKELKSEYIDEIAHILIRRFLERWRKKYKRSVRHWIVNEIGQNNTERMHYHGIVWTEHDITKLKDIWQYGNVVIGEYCSQRTVNYIVKYILKIDSKHKGFIPSIYASAGLGKAYIEHAKLTGKHKYTPNKTNEAYTLPNGNKIGLPIYYRNHLWTEKEREQLWLEKITQEKTYVRGIEIPMHTNEDINNYIKVLEQQQQINKEIGYGDNTADWNKKMYKVRLKYVNAKQKLQKARKNTKT